MIRPLFRPTKRDLLDTIAVLLRRNGLRHCVISCAELSDAQTPLFIKRVERDDVVVSLDMSSFEGDEE